MVVVFWTGTELFVNPISDVDSLPMVEGRSEVVGVCAFTIVKIVDDPLTKDAIATRVKTYEVNYIHASF